MLNISKLVFNFGRLLAVADGKSVAENVKADGY